LRNLQPLFVTIAAYLFLKEKITKYDVLAVVGAFIGVLLMNLTKTDSAKISDYSDLVWLGIFL